MAILAAQSWAACLSQRRFFYFANVDGRTFRLAGMNFHVEGSTGDIPQKTGYKYACERSYAGMPRRLSRVDALHLTLKCTQPRGVFEPMPDFEKLGVGLGDLRVIILIEGKNAKT